MDLMFGSQLSEILSEIVENFGFVTPPPPTDRKWLDSALIRAISCHFIPFKIFRGGIPSVIAGFQGVLCLPWSIIQITKV